MLEEVEIEIIKNSLMKVRALARNRGAACGRQFESAPLRNSNVARGSLTRAVTCAHAALCDRLRAA